MQQDASNARPEHFTLLQSLRGLAALWVVLFHTWKASVVPVLAASLPASVTSLVFGYGKGGVAAFFVLSGFVIAHSLRKADPDRAFVVTFAIRRSIRLDPAYWASIALAVVFLSMMALRHGQAYAAPSPLNVLAHMLYLQEVLRTPEIQVIYWTLTYEVQFYLVFVAALWVRSGMLRRGVARGEADKRVFRPMIVLAFIAAVAGPGWAPAGLFPNYWHGFMLGVLAYRSGHQGEKAWPLLALIAATLAAGPFTSEIFATPAALAAMLLFVAGRRAALSRWLSQRALLALGTISYSLYLTHYVAIRALSGVLGGVMPRTAAGDLLKLVVILAFCLAFAALFWRWVEHPTHRLARSAAIGRRREAGPVLTAV